MKRKLLVSGISGVMLVFAMMVCAGCPIDSNKDSYEPSYTAYHVSYETGEGSGTAPIGHGTYLGGSLTLPGQGDMTAPSGKTFSGWDIAGDLYAADTRYTVGGNVTATAQWTVGGYNPGETGGNTRQEGVYIGIISFAGDAVDLTGGVPVFLDSAGKTTLTSKLSSDYTIASQSGAALFYAVHKAFANLKSRDTQYPSNLESVNVITFTDGLDNGSTGKSAQTPLEDQTFDSDNDYTAYLAGQISGRTIAGKPITAYSVTLLPSGARVRMTFDVTGADPAASSRYIEGVITRTGTGAGMTYTFGGITYAGGLGSDQGAGSIPGDIDGSEVNFTFTGVTGYNPSTDESRTKQWTMPSGETTWQVNTEYEVSGTTNIQIESSSIIYLVLDASTSLSSTQIRQIRDAAQEFIDSLYAQLYGSNSSSGAPTGSSSSNAISLLENNGRWIEGSISSDFPARWYSVSFSGYSSPRYYDSYLSARDRDYGSSYASDIAFEVYKYSGSALQWIATKAKFRLRTLKEVEGRKPNL